MRAAALKKRPGKPKYDPWRDDVKAKLKYYGLKHQALAKHLNIHITKLSQYLNGHLDPTDRIVKLTEGYFQAFNWISQRLQVVVPDNILEIELVDANGKSLGTLDLTNDCVALIKEVHQRKNRKKR